MVTNKHIGWGSTVGGAAGAGLSKNTEGGVAGAGVSKTQLVGWLLLLLKNSG